MDIIIIAVLVIMIVINFNKSMNLFKDNNINLGTKGGSDDE